MAEKDEIKWELQPNSGDLALARNVGGVFRLYNDGESVIQHSKSDNPANNVQPGQTVLVQIEHGFDLTIRLVHPSPKGANGTFQLVVALPVK